MDENCGFETTHWTAILTAADRKADGSITALQKLCCSYWRPIFTYARSQGADEWEARDLTQSFFVHLLERGLSIRSSADRGRFRSFLIRCYRNFVASEWRTANAVKRGGGIEVIAFDEDELEDELVANGKQQLTPEQLYERKWAHTLLNRVYARLEKEYSLAGKLDRFQSIRSCLMSDCTDGNYAKIAEEQDMNIGALRTAVHRMRANFGKLLREEILRVVDDPADVEEELRYVLTLLD